MQLEDFEKELHELEEMSVSDVRKEINQFFTFRQKYVAGCIKEIKKIYESLFGNINGFVQPTIWFGNYQCEFAFALLFKKYGINIIFHISDSDKVIATISKYYVYMSDGNPERKFLSNIINMFANDDDTNKRFVEVAARIYHEKMRIQDVYKTHNMWWQDIYYK